MSVIHGPEAERRITQYTQTVERWLHAEFPHLEVEDIIQEAWLALWKALRNGQIEHPEEEAVIYKLFQQQCRWRAQSAWPK